MGGTAIYIPFLVTGVFTFTFTQSSAMAGVRSISGNLGLVRALHFPRAALPISYALQQLQQMLYSMAVLLVILVAFGHYPDSAWLIAIPVLLCQFVFNTGLALIFARMGAGTPDLAQLLPFILRTWMYSSGVMYSMVDQLKKAGSPHWLIEALSANPALIYIDSMRYALMDNFHAKQLPRHVIQYGVGWALVVGIGGFIFFWKAEERYGRG